MKQETSGAVLELLLSEAADAGASPHAGLGVVVGTLAGIDGEGEASVVFSNSATTEAVPVRSIIALDRSHIGREVVLAFEGDDPRRPIVMGVLHDHGAAEQHHEINQGLTGVEADLDGERVVLTAKREIELRCGKSSITLTRAGKILIRGAYLLSRSSGMNRVKGGSVQIN